MRFSLTIATATLILSATAAPAVLRAEDCKGGGNGTEHGGPGREHGHKHGKFPDGTFPSGLFPSDGAAAATGNSGGPPAISTPSRPITAAPPSQTGGVSSLPFGLPTTKAINFYGASEANNPNIVRRSSDSSDSSNSSDSDKKDESEDKSNDESSSSSKSDSDSSSGSGEEKSGSNGEKSDDDKSSGSCSGDEQTSGGDESSSGSDSSSGDDDKSSSGSDTESGSGSGSGSGNDESSSDSGSGSDESSSGSNTESGSGSGSGSGNDESSSDSGSGSDESSSGSNTESGSGSGSGSGSDESSSDSGSGSDESSSGSNTESGSGSGSGSGSDESSSGSVGNEKTSSGSDSDSTGSGSSNSTTTPSSSTSSSTIASGTFPEAAGESTLSEPMQVTDFDGGMVRFGRGVSCTSGEGGDSDAVFIVADGGSLSNVIIGADQIEGVHCEGACTITNVWWEAVCEDALSFKGDGNGEVSGGGAKGAQDKVVQHNGVGTISISGFYVEDFGKLYRSCGNCKTMGERHVKIDGVTASGGSSTLVGINSNYGDTATITNSCVKNTEVICEEFEGNDQGDEPSKLSSGPSSACIYTDADVNAC